MSDGLTRLTPATRNLLRVLGIVIVLVGLGLIGFGMNRIFWTDSGVDMGDPRWFDAEQEHARPGEIAMFVGIPLLALGGWLLSVGFLRPMSEIVATETGGAVEHSSTRGGRGLGKGLKESGVTGLHGRTIVKVRCRACGAVDDEDAKFCSACGKPM